MTSYEYGIQSKFGEALRATDRSKTIQNFRPMARSLESIYLVESSPSLRQKQHTLLCGDVPMNEHKIGFTSECKRLSGVNVIWTEDIAFIPKCTVSSPLKNHHHNN